MSEQEFAMWGMRLGIGGLCMECKVCHYPVCPFGK